VEDADLNTIAGLRVLLEPIIVWASAGCTDRYF